MSDSSNIMFDSLPSERYMEYATPTSASCVKDGIPMIPFWKGKTMMSYGCGHCGIVVSISNKRLWDMPKQQLERNEC